MPHRAVLNQFPNAMNAQNFSVALLHKLQQEGLDISKVLMATSLCVDEANVGATLFFNELVGPFTFGGLAGYPFTGQTGVAAFIDHVPDNGSAFILYGSHVGVLKDGKIGYTIREKKEAHSTSCGALIGALKAIKAGTAPNLEDTQQAHVYKILNDQKDALLETNTTQVTEGEILRATKAMYTSIHKQVYILLQKASEVIGNIPIALSGGILINTQHGLDSFFAEQHYALYATRAQREDGISKVLGAL